MASNLVSSPLLARQEAFFSLLGASDADHAFHRTILDQVILTFTPQDGATSSTGETSLSSSISHILEHIPADQVAAIPFHVLRVIDPKLLCLLYWLPANAWLHEFPNIQITGVNEGDCAICLEKLSEGESSTSIPEVAAFECGHIFHHDCLSRTMRVSNKCPWCRAPFERFFIFEWNAEQNTVKREKVICIFATPVPGGQIAVQGGLALHYDATDERDGSEGQHLIYVEILYPNPLGRPVACPCGHNSSCGHCPISKELAYEEM